MGTPAPTITGAYDDQLRGRPVFLRPGPAIFIIVAVTLSLLALAFGWPATVAE